MAKRLTRKPNPESNVSMTSNILRQTSKTGLRATKAVGNYVSRTAFNLTKGTFKKVGKWSFRQLKLFIMANIGIILPILIVASVILVSLGSLASTVLVVYAQNKIEVAKTSAEEMVNTYSQYLLEQRTGGNIEYSSPDDFGEDDFDSSSNPSTGGNDGAYNETIDNATKLDGTSLTAQAYNALLESASKSSVKGYNMELIYGISITESCCSPIKWMFYLPVGNDYNASGDYDINKYGRKEFFKARMEGKIDSTAFGQMYNDGSAYIGPYQMDAALFKDGAVLNSITPSEYSSEAWLNLVNGFASSKVTNSEGIADPFNLKDNLEVLSHYMENSRANMIKKMKLNSLTDEEDMYLMALAVRHVGTSNKTKSRSDGCAFTGHDTQPEWRGGNMWCYPFIEGLNPHLDLMRSAINEYKSNGPLFQEYKALLEGQSRTNSNGGPSLTIINKLYAREGWTKNGDGWSKSFGDGDGKVTIKGQDVAYPFRVYWGSKVGFPNFEKIAKGQ